MSVFTLSLAVLVAIKLFVKRAADHQQFNNLSTVLHRT